MNIQEQEEIDFNWGRQTELQNMFEQERIEAQIVNQTPKIKELTAAGFYVAVARYEVCGPWTDAVLGYSTEILSVHRCYDAALDSIGGEESEDNYIAFPECV